MQEGSPLPISALQHYLYCPRQCALIHLEQVWVENLYTAEGRVMHARAHGGNAESRPGLRTERGISLSSSRLGLTGQADVVEFHSGGRVVPVEYKRGKPKAHRADEVQLCAQALCLEEMLAVDIPAGALYYGESRHRTAVVFDASLRELTAATAAALRDMITSRATPAAEYDPGRCDRCSLLPLCLPRALRFKRGAGAWFLRSLGSPSAPPP